MTDQWIIEVCLTCGRLARWPFCEHKPQRFEANPKPWCVSIAVKPTAAGATVLRKARGTL